MHYWIIHGFSTQCLCHPWLAIPNGEIKHNFNQFKHGAQLLYLENGYPSPNFSCYLMSPSLLFSLKQPSLFCALPQRIVR